MRARLLGLGSTALAALLLVLAFHGLPPQKPGSSGWPWDQRIHFTLAAQPFGQLDSGSGVQLGGVRVGTVDGLTIRQGQALVSLEVDRRYAGLLHADTSAMIRPHGLLGPTYVELNGGSHGTLADGSVIPASRVKVAVAVDEVLNAFQPDVRQSLQTLVNELGKGSDGRGQDLNASLQAIAAASSDLVQATSTVHRHDADLQAIISSSEQLNRDLQYAPLDAQLRDTNQVLSGLSEVNGSIGSGIEHTASVLAALDVILDGNTGNLAYTLRTAPAVLLRLRTLLAQGDTILKGINPALPALMVAVVETKSAFGGSDANGHFARVMAVLGTCLVGINLNCSGGPTAGGPPVQVPGAPTPGLGAQAAAPSAPTAAAASAPRASDRELMNLLLGSGAN